MVISLCNTDRNLSLQYWQGWLAEVKRVWFGFRVGEENMQKTTSWPGSRWVDCPVPIRSLISDWADPHSEVAELCCSEIECVMYNMQLVWFMQLPHKRAEHWTFLIQVGKNLSILNVEGFHCSCGQDIQSYTLKKYPNNNKYILVNAKAGLHGES